MTFWGVTDAHTWISGDTPSSSTRYRPSRPTTGVLDALRGGSIRRAAWPMRGLTIPSSDLATPCCRSTALHRR